DGGVRAGARRGRRLQVGHRGCRRRFGRLGDRGARRSGGRPPAHGLGHECACLSSVPGCGGVLRRDGHLRNTPGKGTPVNVRMADIHRSFGKNKAVAGVDLRLGTGVFGLLGPNGAGKTSLLRMLATVLPPTSGEIRLLDRDPRGAAARREIRQRLGYLPQNLGYYPSFTVVEFVEYFALLKEMPSSAVSKAVATAVERVDLGAKARAKLRTLSGGMLRRVGIAQAIVNDPDLLLLDEPTAGLDPEQRVQFRDVLREVGETATVVVSTHLVEDVGAASTEVALKRPGGTVVRGHPH